jgi:hypothetical protein
VVCRRAGYGRNEQSEHCDTIVFSCCPLAGLIDSLGYDRSSHTSGSIDSLGDTRLDKMGIWIFLDQLQEVLAGLVSGQRSRSRSIRLMEKIRKCEKYPEGFLEEKIRHLLQHDANLLQFWCW